MKKQILTVLLSLCLVVGLVAVPAMAATPANTVMATVTDATGTSDEMSLAVAMDAAMKKTGDVTVTLTSGGSLAGWTSFELASRSFESLTIDGGRNAITGLTAPLFGKVSLGGTEEITIKNLTISAADISSETNYAAVLIPDYEGHDAADKLVFSNVTVSDGSVTGAKYVGALVGYASTTGTIVVKDCSISGMTLIGGGSTGTVVGHSNAADIIKTAVDGNTINSTDDAEHVGIVIGTVNGYANVDVVETTENTVQVNGTTDHSRVAGRIVNETGDKLVITGGEYFAHPYEGTYDGSDKTATDGVAETKTVGNDIKYVVYKAKIGEANYTSLAEAVNVGGSITLLGSIYRDTTVAAGKSVTIDLNGKNINGTLTVSGTAHFTDGAEIDGTVSALAVSGKTFAVTKEKALTIPAPAGYAWDNTGDVSTLVPGLWTDLADTSWYKENEIQFTLTTPEQLAGLAKLVNEGTTFEGKTVKLGANIDLEGHTWPGIGLFRTGDKPFKGIFDGDGKTVSGMTFADNGTEEDANTYRGLFNHIDHATVQNLTVNGNGFEAGMTGERGGAMIVGYARSSTIDHCVAEGSITGTHNVAGIVVRLSSASDRGNLVSYCTNNAALQNGHTKIAGIVCLDQNSQNDAISMTVIENCVNVGRITSTAANIGEECGVAGIIAYNMYANLTIKDCENKGVITATKPEYPNQIAGHLHSGGNTVIEGTNKGLASMKATAYPIHGLNYATVENRVATYVKAHEAGKTYLVTALNTKPAVAFPAGASITFDVTLARIDDTELLKNCIKSKTDGNLVTYTVAAAKVGDVKYATLQEAIKAAENLESDNTVTLLADVTENITLSKNLTLVLGSHKLVSTIAIADGVNSFGKDVPQLTISGTHGENDITLPTLAAESGYTFGWYVVTAGTAKTYTARWEANTYAVYFDSNGGSSCNSINVTYNANYGKLPDPTRTGYTFGGWFTDATGGTQVTSETTVAITDIQTLYARWTPVKYAITYDLDGGAVETDNPAGYYITSEPITLVNPTKEGYTFAGWSGTGLSGATESVTIPTGSTENRTYTATWKATQYTITYDLAEGTPGESETNPAEYTIESGAITLVNPTKVGYTFAGWTGTGLSGATESVTIPIGSTGDKVYTANWTAITYTITFDPNRGQGSTGDGSTASMENVTYGQSVNLTTNGFTNTGMKFSGWNTKADGTGTAYANGASVKNLASTQNAKVTLFAIWSSKNTTAPTTSLTLQEKPYNGQSQGFGLNDADVTAGYTVAYRLSGSDGEFSADAPTNAGTYDVQISRAEDSTNDGYAAYQTTLTGGLVIKKATLTATYAGETITYGATPALTVTVTGFVNNEDNGTPVGYVAPTVTATATDAGSYTLTPAGGAADNYDFTYAGGTLTINKATLTVTPDSSKTKVYGTDDPVLTYSFSGVKAGETAAFGGALGREGNENVGSYNITLGTLTLLNNGSFKADNYTLALSGTVTFSITAKEVSSPIITVADAGRYDGTEKKPAVTIYDGNVLIPSNEYTVEYTNNTYAGTATVTITDAADGNYTVTTGSQTFAIGKAQLTVTAGDIAAYVGDAKPTPTVYNSVGLVGGDTFTDPTLGYATEPDMTTAGTATITISGGILTHSDSYEVTYVPGTLTVSNRPAPVDPPPAPYYPPVPSVPPTSTSTTTNPDGSTTTTVKDNITGTVTETTKNNDGSTQTVETKTDGTVTETTENVDGSTETVETKADGTVTETVKNTDGSSTAVETKTDGTVTTTETTADNVKVETVAQPGKDTTVAVSVPTGAASATVTVPVEATPGMVAKDAVTGEIVKFSVATEDGLKVQVEGSADLILVDNRKEFVDTKDHWGEDAIHFVSSRELYQGVGNDTFAPKAAMTRGMLAQVLHNLESNPDHAYEGSFPDLKDTWYTDAILWAAEKGIVNGVPGGGADAERDITREEMVVMLWRYAGRPDSDHDLSSYSDSGKIGSYAELAFAWANELGVINGKPGNLLDPKGTASRAEVAQMMMNFMNALLK